MAVLAAWIALPGPAQAAGPERSVGSELQRMLTSSEIDQATYDASRREFRKAVTAVKRLRGAKRAQMANVVSNVRQIAAGGLLSPSRLPAAMLTLRRNRQWWASGGPLLPYGRRVEFPGSRIVWQSYPGQGLQIQWLGTFGRANALFTSLDHDAELGELLDEVLPLAAERAGGIAWEYQFRFDGGRPPWTSSLSQGTAIQALSRAAVRLSDNSYFEAARSALGIFRQPPPSGVRADTALGAHYLQYSFAPQLHVFNGFIQSLNGLHDFAVLANDEEGRGLFAAGLGEAASEQQAFDTGAWSMYSQHEQSDLGYHKLLRDFLKGLCERLTDDQARALAQQPPPPQPPADPAPWCDVAERFTSYLYTKPDVLLLSDHARAKVPSPVKFSLSKPSTVTLRIARGDRLVFNRSVRFGAGLHAFTWRPRNGAGSYRVRLAAIDLAGNSGATTASIAVLPARRGP
jgi:hypothetical protein